MRYFKTVITYIFLLTSVVHGREDNFTIDTVNIVEKIIKNREIGTFELTKTFVRHSKYDYEVDITIRQNKPIYYKNINWNWASLYDKMSFYYKILIVVYF